MGEEGGRGLTADIVRAIPAQVLLHVDGALGILGGFWAAGVGEDAVPLPRPPHPKPHLAMIILQGRLLIKNGLENQEKEGRWARQELVAKLMS